MPKKKYAHKPLTPTEAAYRAMITRVKLKNGQYGRRGWYKERNITVCDRWLPDGYGTGYKNFLKDMGEKPEGKSLDRIDNDKGYSPDNCRWTNWHVQNANRSNCTGHPGVWKDSEGYWRAVLKVNGKYVLQTRKAEREDALAARIAAEQRYHIYD